MYDVHGTIEEVRQFTDAIEKWDISSLDQLPEYMRHCYQSLLDIFAEAILQRPEGHHIKLTRAHLQEAEWCQVNYFPTFEEYMNVALVTGAFKMLLVSSFVLMGDVATRESFDWMSKDPLIVRASSVICRLSDDIVEKLEILEI
ncbi:hypothetical protein POM88_009672 [Heracleum sosnowskyi]|uniref:Terpene synthase metal-binding domain-containing protein n=1 Tax=Heracleum sosnowskyi TaxID=360622 RepID=A0AAD8JAD0_9APIA|nr:hypothetical protein POM88_009672 [Heracleum sosnowskyi]